MSTLEKVLADSQPRAHLDDWCYDNWLLLPYPQRRACVEHLRKVIPSEVLTVMRAQHAAGKRIGSHLLGFHFGYGMFVRNELRGVVRDEDLLPVKQPDGSYGRNWDDYYTGALEELVDLTPPVVSEEYRWPSGWWILPALLLGSLIWLWIVVRIRYGVF